MDYDYDVAIIGAGAAGMSAAVYAGRSGSKTVLFDKDTPGGQTLLSPDIENYLGFKSISGPDLCDIMAEHARQYCDLKELEEVQTIEKLQDESGAPSGFHLTTSKGQYTVGVLILSMGAHHKHLGVPGEEKLSGKGVSSCATCDGYFFREKKVVMVGGGNTAALETIFLKGINVDVEMIHRRDQLRAEEAYVDQLGELGVKIHWNSELAEIKGEDKVESVRILNNETGDETMMEVNGVFVAIGILPNNKLTKALGCEHDEQGYVKVDAKTMQTNVPRVYACGDIVSGSARQIATGVGQGCVAALQANVPLGKAYPF